jgi:hypothetical protein
MSDILSAEEYERIYQVTFALLDGRRKTSHACIFFAVIGSLILNKHHGIPATPVAGAFFLRPNESMNVLAFGQNSGNQFTSDRNGFHVWIQTTDHIVDFMAPIFEESFRKQGNHPPIPRRMFQRHRTDEASSIESMEPGGYFTLPNVELTKELVDRFGDRPSNVDLIVAADRWYKKHPQPLESLMLISDLGEQYPLMLTAPAMDGRW